MVRRYRSRISSRKTYTIQLKTLAMVLAPGMVVEFVRLPPGEWTASPYLAYPFLLNEELKESRSRKARVVRGGAWDCGLEAIRAPRPG